MTHTYINTVIFIQLRISKYFMQVFASRYPYIISKITSYNSKQFSESFTKHIYYH